MFYCVDKLTGKRASLKTTVKDAAQQVIDAKNQAERQPVLNLHITKAYLAGTDNGMATRTWQNALDALINAKLEVNQHRWKTAAKDKALAALLPRVIVGTPGDLLLEAMKSGKVSTNVYLRRLHNFCVDMNWLPWPVLVHLGAEALNVFKDLSGEGVLFPYLSRVRAGDRATEFGQRCRQFGITGITLHSYRYAWQVINMHRHIWRFGIRFKRLESEFAMDLLGQSRIPSHTDDMPWTGFWFPKP